MKKYLLIIILLFSGMAGFSQTSLYYKAVYLKAQIKNNQITLDDNAYNVLQDLFPAGTTNANIVATLNANPFLLNMFVVPAANQPQVAPPGGNGAMFALPPAGAVSSALSSIGGLNVTNFADGAAKFLIQRGKEELAITFFSKFKDILNSNPDLKVLFPNTVDLLNAIDQQIYNYSVYLQNLREAFKKDIAALPKDLPGIVNINHDFFVQYPDLRSELLGACYIAGELENHTHPGDILANFPDSLLNTFSTVNPSQSYFKGAIQTLQLLSASVKDTVSTDSANYWVGIGKIRGLVGDQQTFNLFLGLLYQKASNDYGGITYDATHSFNMFLATVARDQTNINTYKQFILGLGSRLDQLNKMIGDNKTVADSVAIAKYANYLKATVGFLQYCTSVSDLPYKTAAGTTTIGKTLNYDFHLKFQPYFDIADHVADIVTNITGKNYSAAINDVIFVYNTVTVIPQQTAAAAAIAAAAPQPGTQAANNARTTQNPAVTAAATSTNNLSVFAKYATFMAAIATANNSDDVEAAIEAAALPPGSYSVKQKSRFNISLNGYVGYGWDVHAGQGITAPIGFSATLGTKHPYGVPVTVFVGIIDVGAVVAYRSNDTTTNSLKQQITLESIIAPSAQVFVEVPKWPVAIGAGWRMSPKLSYSKDSGFITVPSKSAFNISILIDIPIFTLHNVPLKDY
jgi:tetratricopeptide (TPR) repeat protein